jgi:hypothetical protein
LPGGFSTKHRNRVDVAILRFIFRPDLNTTARVVPKVPMLILADFERRIDAPLRILLPKLLYTKVLGKPNDWWVFGWIVIRRSMPTNDRAIVTCLFNPVVVVVGNSL